MKALNVIYHLARADFLDRTRRYSFLIMLGAVVFLGYQAGVGNILYLFLFLLTLPLLNSISKIDPAFEHLGFALFQESMGEAAKVAYPGYDGGFVLGSTDIPILGVSLVRCPLDRWDHP